MEDEMCSNNVGRMEGSGWDEGEVGGGQTVGTLSLLKVETGMYVFPTLVIELSASVPVLLAVPTPHPHLSPARLTGCPQEEPANKDKLDGGASQ